MRSGLERRAVGLDRDPPRRRQDRIKPGGLRARVPRRQRPTSALSHGGSCPPGERVTPGPERAACAPRDGRERGSPPPAQRDDPGRDPGAERVQPLRGEATHRLESPEREPQHVVERRAREQHDAHHRAERDRRPEARLPQRPPEGDGERGARVAAALAPERRDPFATGRIPQVECREQDRVPEEEADQAGRQSALPAHDKDEPDHPEDQRERVDAEPEPLPEAGGDPPGDRGGLLWNEADDDQHGDRGHRGPYRQRPAAVATASVWPRASSSGAIRCCVSWSGRPLRTRSAAITLPRASVGSSADAASSRTGTFPRPPVSPP